MGRTTLTPDPRPAHRLGRDLRDFLYQPDVVALLDGHAATWVAGGCRLLGGAVGRWLAPAATLLVLTHDGRPQHVVAVVGRWRIDGDGVCGLPALLARWRRHEGVARPAFLPYDDGMVDVAEWWWDARTEAALVARLRRWRAPEAALALLAEGEMGQRRAGD
jgi:hypothetical protein